MESRSGEAQTNQRPRSCRSSFYEIYKSKRVMFRLSLAEIILGSVMFTAGIVSIFTKTGFYFNGHGIWCGLTVLIAGSMGAAGFKGDSQRSMHSSLMFNILSTFFGGVSIHLTISEFKYITMHSYGMLVAGLTVSSFLVLSAFVATIIAVVLAIRSCHALEGCCYNVEAKATERASPLAFANTCGIITMDGQIPSLEKCLAYLYCDGAMTLVEVFLPTGQSTSITSPAVTLDVSKVGLLDPGYLPEGEDHAPPVYQD